MNGKLYPHPPLLFKACGSHLWVRALAKDERPTAETKLCMAPYWNCYDNGRVLHREHEDSAGEIGVGH